MRVGLEPGALCSTTGCASELVVSWRRQVFGGVVVSAPRAGVAGVCTAGGCRFANVARPRGSRLAGEIFASGGDSELAMFDAFGGDEFVGDLLHQRSLAAHDQHFEAVVVVEVDVQGGNNNFVVVVLDVGERGLDVLLVVVVKEGDGAGDFLMAEVLAMLDQAGADEVSHGEGAVVVALFAGHLVELLGQVARHGNGKADNAVSLRVFHGNEDGTRAAKRTDGSSCREGPFVESRGRGDLRDCGPRDRVRFTVDGCLLVWTT